MGPGDKPRDDTWGARGRKAANADRLHEAAAATKTAASAAIFEFGDALQRGSQLSRKLLSFLDRLGCFSLRSAFASI